uniref:NADH:ubiquinone reductase (H(+)-translocating) n=1 Tax=Sphecodes ephippius TaxID=1126396 RepID=A0A0S2LTM1_9HYME|nr:NADH dehydrogenase subunit 5 [Sphecodes ephippius]
MIYYLIIYSLFMLLLSLIMFLVGSFFYLNKMILILEWMIFMISGMKFNYVIYLDYMGMFYIGVVLLISFFILIYSKDYMFGDVYINRFKYLLMLFILSMCLMILSPNILSLLLGWDGLGLISYCLVIYYQNMNSYTSGMLTILCNRLGDVGLLMLIAMMSYMGSWNLILYGMFSGGMMFMFMAIITKSAQMPFSAWLPAAMTAPTPISSLVHSSTLVTAGVYLLIRYNKFFNNMDKTYLIIISGMTMFMAGIMANYEYNLKKIVALSTLSQLGFMMSILGMGMVELGFYHLLIHAFFKSLMFMCVGGFMHVTLNCQDLRKFKGVMWISPFKTFIFMFSLMNLSGFPFFSGFYSKDLILEFMNINKLNMIMVYILMINTFLTINYSVRIMKLLLNFYMTIFSYQYINDGKFMIFCKMMLFMIVVIFGLMYMEIFNYYTFMITSYEKNILMLIYISSWSLNLSFYYSDNMKYNFKFYNFILMMFYSIYLYKIIYLNLMNFIMKYEKFNEKWLDKMMGLNMNNIYFLKNYKIIHNWFYSIYAMKLMKFYVILLIYMFMF